MRILSYNILDGGKERADALAAVIEPQRPDVVGLVEADDKQVVERLAGRLKMDVLHAPGNSHASALLSRWPIRESINHAVLHPAKLEKSLLEATVAEPSSSRQWTIGVVHLHAHGTEEAERRREQEIDVVLGVFENQRLASGPHVLCGDFNANAPYQVIDPQKCKPRTRREWVQNGGGLPRRVVQRILDAGYRDSLYEFDRKAGATQGTFSTEFPGQRVDYIFTFGIEKDRLKRAWIIYDPPARDASDHFPVGLEVE
jgi:endonuclease/exonuclease/phosphatase family metal-dependent hydrolase